MMVCADYSTKCNAALIIDQYPLLRFEDVFEALNSTTIFASLDMKDAYLRRFTFQSMAALQAEVARLQAENDQLRRALADVNGGIVCDQLTGKLPDNFLEQFSQLPDRPLEHVLRFLPAHQVAQMRHVSHKFNNTKLADGKVALSELLRFIHIGGRMFFGEGLSAADKVLDQLSKAWLTIRPEVVIFAGDFSQTSRDSLRAFLVKVKTSIRRLHFQAANNIADNLLNDDLIGAAGRLDGLMVLPISRSSKLPKFNIGDDTLLAMAVAYHMPSYVCVMGCSGITPGGIRAFVEKWLKKERALVDLKPLFGLLGWQMCELVFYKCANVKPAAVDEACGDLLKKDTTAIIERREMNDQVQFAIQHSAHTLSKIPRINYVVYNEIEYYYDLDLDNEDDGDNENDDYDINYYDSFIFLTDRSRDAAARAVDGGGGGGKQMQQIDVMVHLSAQMQ
uniref:F-box domain-containing protein n=1 Tax=Plectus sambesii TaxID=2011161 RepID=A0A914VJ09_9BILA